MQELNQNTNRPWVEKWIMNKKCDYAEVCGGEQTFLPSGLMSSLLLKFSY